MGPRMLLEAAPGWMMVTTVGGVELVSRILPSGRQLNGRISLRSGVAGGLAFALLVSVLVLTPQRVRSYAVDDSTLAQMEPPRVDHASLVFVHGAWIGRVGMRLAAGGVALDTVETLLRQNPTCFLHTLTEDLTSPDAQRRSRALARLDVAPRSGGLPPQMEIAPGNRIRALPGERLTEDCLREARSDGNGILDIAPLIWQGDLPGVPGEGPLFVRDLGPEANARLIAAMPERTPYVYYKPATEVDASLVPYSRGIKLLWPNEQVTS
jgi:hypothetical protein